MAGWNTWAALKADFDTGLKHDCMFAKGGGIAIAAAIPSTHWRGGINPPAGSFPAAGLGSAVAVSRADVGAMQLPHVDDGTKDTYVTHLSSTRCNGAWTVNDIETIMLCDRLAHVSIALNQATGAITPALDGTARLAAGEGAMIIAEVHTALSAASNVFTLTYTNEAGVTGRTTQQVSSVASAIVDRVPYAAGWYIPFQDGDAGARAITGWNLVSGTATGTLTIALVKPICMLGGVFRGSVYERNFAIQLPWMPKVHRDAALMLMHQQVLTGNDLRLGAFGVISK